jgi:hypothetical protein
MRLLRLVPWCLVGVNVYLNVAGQRHPIGAIAQSVVPLLWVIAVESGGHATRTWAGLDGRATRGEAGGSIVFGGLGGCWRQRPRCGCGGGWCCGRPRAMWRLSAANVSGSWRAPSCRTRGAWFVGVGGRLAGRGRCTGWGSWRPRGAAVTESTPAEGKPAKRRRSGGGRSNRRAKPRVPVEQDELVAASRAVAAELAEDDVRLTRATLLGRLRAGDLPVSNARASELLALLRRGPTTTDDGPSEALAR